MAYIPLNEVPNAPSIQEMPLPEYQKIPSIRHAGVNMKVDMSGAARSLQQDALPGGFASGLARATASAGSGAMAMGKAISQGTGELGNAIGRAGYVLSKFAEKAIDQADSLAGVKAHENQVVMNARFEAETAGMTMAEKQEAWPKYHAELVAMNSNLGVRQHTRDIINSHDEAWGKSKMYGIQTDAIKKSVADNNAYTEERHKRAVETPSAENVAVARQTNLAALESGQINKATFEERERTLDIAAKREFIAEKAADPYSAQWLKGEAEKQQRGEKNDLFTKDDDISLVNNADDLATKTINESQRTNAIAVQDRLVADPTSVTKEELQKLQQDGQISGDQFYALDAKREAKPISYNDVAVADALSIATNYDRNSDVDAKGRPTMAKYDAAVRQIMTTVPKDNQDEILKILKDNWDKTPDRSPQSEEAKLAHANIKELAESGIIADPDTKKPMPSGMDKGKIVNEEQARTSARRQTQLHRMVQDYVKAHPDFKENELLDYIWNQAKGVAHANVSAEAAGVTPPLISSDPSFYANIGMPGAPVVGGETKAPKQAPPTPDQVAAAKKAAQEGRPIPIVPLPTGPGAPVEVTVYDRGDRTFRQARLAATPELLKIVDGEAKIYDTILKSDEVSLRGKLGIIEGDALDPDMKEGIVRKATEIAKAKKIPLEQAGMEVIQGLKDEALKDKARIEDAMKFITPKGTVTGAFSGKLTGKEDAFAAAATKHGLDPLLLMAISMHETGRGTSDMMQSKNNPGGLFDSKTDQYMSFASPEAGIEAMAKNLKGNYIDQGLTTIAQIQQKYAPVGAANDPKGQNKEWVAGVTGFYNQLKAGTAAQNVSSADIDPKSQKQLASLFPQVQARAVTFMSLAKKWAAQNGVQVVVTEGYRTPERQEELYRQGRGAPGPIVTNARAGQSKHQSKRAFDVAILKNGKEIENDKLWRELGALGKQAGLEWGGDFKSIYDPNHFQYMG